MTHEPRSALPTTDGSRDWCGGAATATDDWLLTYDEFEPALEGTREALCTLGKGYWATRGSAPGSRADGVHYPGTYFAGVYNRLQSTIGGRVVEDEQTVNTPDWMALSVGPPGEPPWVHGDARMLSSYQQLDVHGGVLTRVVRYRDASGSGGTTQITSRSLVHLIDKHLAVLETTVEALDWSGQLVVRSGLDGGVVNANVLEYAALANRHLEPVGATQVDSQTVLLEVVTSQSHVHIAMASRVRIRDEGADDAGPAAVVREESRLLDQDPGYIGQEFTLTVRVACPVTIDKVVTVATSRDSAVSNAALSATARIDRAPEAATLLRSHQQGWERLWTRFGVELGAGERPSLALNLNTFHVLQTVAAAGPDLDAGIPAPGLHGEGYRGHVFGDEVLVYPMLTLRRPDLTRGLLHYRYLRLEEARAAARQAGLDGAMFPWQSGSDGREETPAELLNPRSGRWMADNSRRQRHVGLAVAYSVWRYNQASGDLAYLRQEGAEVMVEVVRFFASLATHNAHTDRFDIAGVMGPDEFHDGYPGAPGEGLRNNSYTTVLLAWLIGRTLEAVALLSTSECHDQPTSWALRAEEPEYWETLSRRLRVPFHPDGVISQFEGYEDLAEFDWDGYRARYVDISRLDLILAAEGDSPNNYRLAKQADVLMLLYLLSAEELRAVLARLGYRFPAAAVLRTVDFYLARTSHGSTLSRLAHSWVSARSDREVSWSLFLRALDSDLDDIQGGTTREGVHIGAMAGSVDLVLRCFGGLETRDSVLRLHPVLPIELARVAFRIVYRGQPLDIELTHEQAQLTLHRCASTAVEVCVEDQLTLLRPGDVHVVALTPTAA
jgi:trehalose/maltose hydrolase-like predicted phosphorylase